MQQLFTLIIFFFTLLSLHAQWEKNTIVLNEFQDTQQPIWLDLNADGLDDLLGFDDDISTFFWKENDGSQLLPPQRINNGAHPLTNKIFTTGDWDHDGDIDILAHLASSSSFEINCLLLLNNADGTFTQSEFQFESQQFFGEINRFGDFNNDGFADLIVEHSSNYYVYLFANGTYESIDYNLNTSQTLSTQLYLVDMDGDNDIEILEITDDFGINFHEWNNNTLSITKSITVPYPGSKDYSISTGMQFKDLDFDGDLDIFRSILDIDVVIVGDVGNVIAKSTYLYEHLQDENGIYSSTGVYTSQYTGNDFQYALVSRKPNDAYSIITFDGPNYSETFYQNGASPFNINTTYEIPESSKGLLSSRCLFFEGEENLVSLHLNNYTISVGLRSLVPEEIWVWENCINCSDFRAYEDIVPVDLDGDGDLDILVSDPSNQNQISWIENYLDGCHFENVKGIIGQYFNASSIKIASADLDNDGDNDLVVKINVDEAEFYILKNDGSGVFSAPSLLFTIPYGVDLYAEDIYGDGYAEIIIHTGEFSFTSQDTTTFTTTILNNTSGIENYNAEYFQNSTDSGRIEFADMDNDGDTDMIVYNDDPFNESIVIYTNDGLSLSQAQLHDDFIDMFAFNVFDFNKDNYPDIFAFHDGLSNNNISTVYQYPNTQGLVDFQSPTFIFENIDRYQHLGIHNPDNSIGFVSKTGLGNKGVLVYYNQSGILDTLDSLNPENYQLADLNNDGFDDILVADNKGGFNFYTQGSIDCNQPCVPDTDGYLYFTQCNSLEYFVIETNDGEILDPYFDAGVNFNYFDGQYVKFSFTDFEIATDCEDVRTVLIQCIEEVLHIPTLTDFDWVQSLIDESAGCCEIEKIEAYYDLNTTYIYISPRSDCSEFRERLYNENEVLLCIEPETFNNECIIAYGLDQLDKTLIYECNPVANENIFDESLIEIFPNPSSHTFNIKTDFKGKLKIYNAQGKYLMQHQNIPSSIDLGMLNQGIYFLSFENKAAVITKMIIYK